MTPQETKQRLLDAARDEPFGPNAGPGLYLDVPEEKYHAHHAISRSILAEAARKSPLHAVHSLQSTEEESSDAMDLGTAVHARVLEPDIFGSRYDVAPDQCEATKADGDQCSYSPSYRYGGGWYCGTHAPDEEPDDIEVLKSKHYHAAEGMAQALQADQDTSTLLYELPGLEEVTVLFGDPKTGLQLRARLDRVACLPDGRVAIVDLKTTRSAHPQDFRHKIARNGYWLQPAFYGSAVRSLDLGLEVADFVFAVVESSAPYAVQGYRPSDNDRRGAERRMGSLVNEMADALDNGSPGYREGVTSLEMKRYEKDRLQISA